MANAQAASAPAPIQRRITETEAAALLIQSNRFDDAKRVLAHVLETNPNDNEAIFLRGIIAVAEKDYDAAIEDFRRILVSEPERERVRLELARAFFLKRDYDNAERNFRFARAGDLPDDVKRNIDSYLAAIVRLREWSYDLGLAVAADTNANGATTAHQIDIYGLPFTLSDNAREKSGTGLAFDVGGEWSPLLSDTIKGKLGAHVHRLEYGGNKFDDMTVSSYAGPEFLFPRWQIDTLATASRRWFGGTPYSEGAGGRLAATYSLVPQVQIGAAFDAQSIFYRVVTDQNGLFVSGDGEVTYTISPSSIVHFVAGIGEQGAKVPVFSDTTHWLAFDYYQDLPFGFSTNLEPAYSWTRYDAPLAAFGVTRSDRIWALKLDVLNRRIEYAGFAPRLSLIYAQQSSSVSLYRFHRLQVQVGLTREF